MRMRDLKKAFNFGNRGEEEEYQDDDFPSYLEYDEEKDKIRKAGRVRKRDNDEDSFDLQDFLNEEEESEDTSENEEEIHQNKAKPILIIGFVFMLLVIIIAILWILLAKSNNKKPSDNTDTGYSQTTDNKNDENASDGAKEMYGDGYFKVYNKNVKYYTAMDTINIFQNANDSIRKYFSEIKNIESEQLTTIERKKKIDELETTIAKDYATLETASKVFDKFGEDGVALYNQIYERFENVEALMSAIKFLNSGSESTDRINGYIDIENQKVDAMSDLIVQFAKDNNLQYTEEDNQIKIDK